MQFDFTAPITKTQVLEKHKRFQQEVIKHYQDHMFDCEYELRKIIKDKQEEIRLLNQERRREMTHNQEQYVELQIP